MLGACTRTLRVFHRTACLKRREAACCMAQQIGSSFIKSFCQMSVTVSHVTVTRTHMGPYILYQISIARTGTWRLTDLCLQDTDFTMSVKQLEVELEHVSIEAGALALMLAVRCSLLDRCTFPDLPCRQMLMPSSMSCCATCLTRTAASATLLVSCCRCFSRCRWHTGTYCGNEVRIKTFLLDNGLMTVQTRQEIQHLCMARRQLRDVIVEVKGWCKDTVHQRLHLLMERAQSLRELMEGQQVDETTWVRSLHAAAGTLRL